MEKKFMGILDFWFTWGKKFAEGHALKKRVNCFAAKPI